MKAGSRWAKFISLPILMTLLLCLTALTASAVPYRSYTYDVWGNPVSAPQAYVPVRVVDGLTMGVGPFRGPRDIFIDNESMIYIADTGNQRIVIADPSWNAVRIISQFERDGIVDQFRNPEGLHVTVDGTLYVADTGNGRILLFDREGVFIREIGPPPADLEGIIPENFEFRPRRIAVDDVGRLYVVAEEVNDGMIEFDVSGKFRGFIGAPRVAPNPLDVLWRAIATREQRERMVLFTPTEFLSVSVDDRGFIYATVPPTSIQWEDAIRRLNPTGVDVLRRGGFHPPIGDVRFTHPWESASITGRSVLRDVVAHGYGIYSALDQRRGRVFTYDSGGNLLHVFGGVGNQVGTFQSAIAMTLFDGHIVVLDNVGNAVSIFEQTEYGRLITEAIRFHETGEYDAAEMSWRQILGYNANYDLAYTGIGKAHLRRDEFREAMTYFRYGHDRRGYSDAFRLYRRQVLGEHFGSIMAVLLIGSLAVYSTPRVKRSLFIRREKQQSIGEVEASVISDSEQFLIESDSRSSRLMAMITALGYSRHLITHPIGGFWDLKHERKGNLPAALALLCMVCLTYIVMHQYTGFLFNPFDPNSLNILVELASVLVPFALWTLVNWSLTTLMDGKGTPKDVAIATAYALTPIIIINFPATLLSNYLTLEEGAFYYLLISLSTIWSFVLLFTGTMVTHDYTILKTTLTIVAIVAGIMFVLFIGLLFFSIADILSSFVTDIYRELVFRL